MHPLTSGRGGSAQQRFVQRMAAVSRCVARRTTATRNPASLMIALALISACQNRSTAALESAVTFRSPREVEALLRAGANPNIESRSGEPLLWRAVRLQRYDNAVVLLQNGANPKTQFYRVDILFPVVSAAPRCPIDALRALLRAGADPNTVNMYTGDTPLMVALEHGAEPCADLLLSAGAKSDVRNLAGGTPLHSAAKGSSSKMVAKILGLGIGIDSVMTQGTTPLMLAAARRPEGGENELVIATLLDHRANPCLKNASGLTAADIALRFGFTERAQRLAEVCGAWQARQTPRN